MSADFPPKVSVIVPVYDAAATVGACIESLLAQSDPGGSFEIVAVDNASTDGTAAILRSFGDRIRVLREERRGPAAARNCGVRASSGELIAQTDSDCVADRDWLRNLVRPFEDASVGLAGGRILSIAPGSAVSAFGEEIHDHEKAINVYRPPYVITMNWAARRSLFDAAGWFDEDLLRCEDVDLAWRAWQLGVVFAYAADAVVFHHNEVTLRGLFREGVLHGLYSVQAIRKHSTLLAALGHRPLNLRSWSAIGSAVRRGLSGEGRERAWCEAVFNGGKKIGKLAGSIRFRHFDA